MAGDEVEVAVCGRGLAKSINGNGESTGRQELRRQFT
jgi:hypothetical protein